MLTPLKSRKPASGKYAGHIRPPTCECPPCARRRERHTERPLLVCLHCVCWPSVVKQIKHEVE